jgi:hypothetical protein
VTVRGTGPSKGVAIVADLGYVNRSEEGNIKAEQNITSEFISILICREENMPSSMSRNKSVEGLQCHDSRGYIDEYDIAVILCI